MPSRYDGESCYETVAGEFSLLPLNPLFAVCAQTTLVGCLHCRVPAAINGGTDFELQSKQFETV